MNFDRSWIEKLVLRDDNNRRIVQIVDFRKEFTVVNKGENFMSEVSRVTLKALTGSGKESEYSFIVKEVPDSDAMRSFLTDLGFFDREIRAYSEILRSMEDLMRINGDCRENPWCQIKGYIPESVIVLEDLNASGYQKVNKCTLLDEEHAVCVLNELSRFHAMGMSLIAQNVINLDNLNRPQMFDERMQTMFHVPALTALRDAIQTTWGSTWSDLLIPINQIIENRCLIIKQLEMINQKSLNVISHGDCWTGNFMFKKDFRGKILSMKFVDFQYLGPSTFAYDLCIFLKNSVEKEVRTTKLDHLLYVYHANLKANAEYFNVEPQSLPTLSEVKNTLESLEILSFLLMCTYYPAAGDVTDLDVSGILDDKQGAYSVSMYSNEKCKRVLGQELRDIIAKGCFEKNGLYHSGE